MNNVNMANMANMGAMGGPVGAAMGMVNNGAIAPPGGPRQVPNPENNRMQLNSYIYEYFVRFEMYDCARAMLASNQPIKTEPRKQNENGIDGDQMDTDTKDDMDSKRPDDLPAPSVASGAPDSCFLMDWFNLFWDMFNAQKGKGSGGPVAQYVNHTQQQQTRMRQAEQQNMLRQMRPEAFNQQQQYMMRNMQNGGMMNMKQANNLPRTAMANSQNNPQAMQMLQQKQGQMPRDPSDMEGNRPRPSSPGSADNAPSPSKRPRLDGGAPFPNQAGLMPNGGRPVGPGMPGQQVGAANPQQHVQQLLLANNINPSSLSPDQLQTFTNQSPAVQAKTIATYAQNLQQHHNQQLPGKAMPNATGPPGQGSPMVPQDPTAITQFYNAGEMGGPNAMRPGTGANGNAGTSNHALQDYQMQLMLLEQQNKKRLMMARQEQDGMAGLAREGGPGGPPGPNAQPFQGTSPPGSRTGASPNPAEQMKRNQMGAVNMGSPLPDNANNRSSPNPAVGLNMAPNFFNGMNNMEGNMPGAQMNGMRPPNAHPGQGFNGPMNQQQMMAARQQQQGGQGGPPMQWQGGPNGGPMPQGQQAPQMQGTPQQRAMPPPSAPTANANQRTQTASPQVSNAAPPTPQQAAKANPKKKATKAADGKKGAGAKKANANAANAGATPAADAAPEPEPPTPATPITPVNPQSFNKGGQNAGAAPVVPNGQVPAPPQTAPPAAPQPPNPDPNQNLGAFNMDSSAMDFGSMEFANPLTSGDVLNDFDFDSFLHDTNDDAGQFDFATGSFSMEGAGEIGAE